MRRIPGLAVVLAAVGVGCLVATVLAGTSYRMVIPYGWNQGVIQTYEPLTIVLGALTAVLFALAAWIHVSARAGARSDGGDPRG